MARDYCRDFFFFLLLFFFIIGKLVGPVASVAPPGLGGASKLREPRGSYGP
jgi:hypothetical protein